ncbi:MAG TPA: pyrroline-5-carboxylate reductase [Clostridiaceae bacterium]|nr:pyrroline-5-carboxylate reductase [Clostridiaceae bacterium]
MDRNIGVIGTGVMGSALMKGIIQSGLIPASRVFCFDANLQRFEDAARKYGAVKTASSSELAEKSDIIILAVKPYQINNVLESIKSRITGNKTIVSIAAGVSLKQCEDIIGGDKKVVRAMPNTPLQVGEGMTLLSFNKNVGSAEKTEIKAIFECAGKAEELEESLMNEVIALTSSSPAYVFMFIEAMSDAAVQSGIPRDLSYRLAAQAVLGSAKMVLETGKHPGELKDQVCTPAGTTIEAVAALEKNHFRSSVMEAMQACTKKAMEMSKRYA